jgi:hypothetical protein
MKKEYTRSMMIADLADAKVTLYVYEGCKYTAKSAEDLGDEREVSYHGIAGWDIIEGGKEAEEIEADTDADGIDEFHEYLVLHLLNGETATFRNSHVDMFLR